MDKKDLKRIEEKLEEFDQLLSYQNTLLSEIKEILEGFKWLPVSVVGFFIGWWFVEKVYKFFFPFGIFGY